MLITEFLPIDPKGQAVRSKMWIDGSMAMAICGEGMRMRRICQRRLDCFEFFANFVSISNIPCKEQVTGERSVHRATEREKFP